MKYLDFVKNLKECPFCNLKKEEILKENNNAIIILAKAPYTENHLIVIPKKHVLEIASISKEQKESFEEIVSYGLKKLREKYDCVSILYREGDGKDTGKSISHAHYNLIPKMKILPKGIDPANREIYPDKEYLEKTKDAKKNFKIK